MKTIPEIIVALDVKNASEIRPVVDRLPSSVHWYKVGLELFSAAGPRALEYLQAQAKSIFLDLKLHDIPRTVERSVSAAASHGVAMMTVHASGGPAMIRAAAEAAAKCAASAPRIVAVTVLTSMDEADLARVGVAAKPADQVLLLARMAVESGADGLVCSPNEVAAIRAALGPAPILVTPGIRPASAELGDQKRVATPAAAAKAGSNYLVIGRPILEAPDPAAAVMAIERELHA